MLFAPRPPLCCLASGQWPATQRNKFFPVPSSNPPFSSGGKGSRFQTLAAAEDNRSPRVVRPGH